MSPTISAINIHPLKAAAIKPLLDARIGPYGLQDDRTFMIVDATGTLITQRNPGKEHIALIRAELLSEELILTAPGMRPLVLPRNDSSRQHRTVTVHADTCSAFDCGAEAAAWVTGFLGEHEGAPLALVQFDTTTIRPLNSEWYPQENRGTAFADGGQILVTSEESLRELNDRLRRNGAQPLPMSRFRPNIVLQGLEEPFAEDRIDTISSKDGKVQLKLTKPCARCPVTTVDQEVGALGADRGEPLKTLATFRRGRDIVGSFPSLPQKMQGQVFFGMNATVISGEAQVIRVEDEVRVTYRKLD